MGRSNRNGLESAYKKIIIAIVILFSVLSVSTVSFFINYPQTGALAGTTSYAVIDVASGKCILQKDANIRLPMASTTKIMTALVIIENYDLKATVTIEKSMTNIEGSSVYLKEGEKLSLNDLLYCLLLRSGNDSAVALAMYAGETIERFAEMMNLRAESLSLSNTHYMNPHGLDHEQHYTSALDLATLSVAAIRNPVFREIVSTKQIRIGEGISERILINKNKMLSRYKGAIGIKTGYTKKSGRCLVSAAEKNGQVLVCAVLNCPDTYGTSAFLLDRAFDMLP